MRENLPAFSGIDPLTNIQSQRATFPVCAVVGISAAYFLFGGYVALASTVLGYVAFVAVATMIRIFFNFRDEAHAKAWDPFVYLGCIVGVGAFISLLEGRLPPS